MRSPHMLILMLSVLAAGLLAGCAQPPGVVFDPAAAGRVWPDPPETPRIRYLGSLRANSDLKAARSSAEVVGDVLFGKEPAQAMVSPMGVCTDGNDRVFITDSNAQCIHVFDLDSRRYQRWMPKKGMQLLQPVAAAYAAGRLYVSDAGAGAIAVFDDKGNCPGFIGSDHLERPCGLAVEARTGRLFIADAGLHQVVILTPEGVDDGRIGSRGQSEGRFNFPTQVAFDSAGNLYISDSLNFRVQVMTPGGTFIRQIGRKGDIPGTFGQPKGIGLDQDDHLYVVDAHFEAVQIFDQQGALLLAFGREGRGAGEFWLPAGLCTDQKGRIWIADSYNRRVQAFQYLGSGDAP